MRARGILFAFGAAIALGPFAAACAGTNDNSGGDDGGTGASAAEALHEGDAAHQGDGGRKIDGKHEKKPDCVGCHMADYLDVRHPPHKGAKPTTCAICHTQQKWHPSVIDHPWPLTGKHDKLDCFKCHTGEPPKFKGTSKKCYACHAAEYDKPPFPDHNLLQKTCEDCHTTTDWKNLVPHPIWPPEEDAGPPDAGHDAGHDAGTAAKPTATATAKPKPKPTGTPTVVPPPDVTTGGSRHIRR